MKIVVLGGGDSPEREVSLQSAKAVANAARAARLEVIEQDPKNGLDFFDVIDKNCVVLPILHGAGGEDGVIQKELENRKLAFLGSDSVSSANCFDKWKTRQILLSNDMPMPRGDLVTRSTYAKHPVSQMPHALKVLHGGSSIGTLIVQDPASLNAEKINELFKTEEFAVIEELIAGTEITVPILDQRALPVIEIIPPPNAEFDYENKYNGKSQELCPPKSVSEDLQQRAQKLAEQVHRAMNCRHLSRVDIMIDKSNQLYILEINTIPGMTEQSLYPKSAAVAGLSMPELVKFFVDMAGRDSRAG
jgi:D-alanine-D-alanine ligase